MPPSKTQNPNECHVSREIKAQKHVPVDDFAINFTRKIHQIHRIRYIRYLIDRSIYLCEIFLLSSRIYFANMFTVLNQPQLF